MRCFSYSACSVYQAIGENYVQPCSQPKTALKQYILMEPSELTKVLPGWPKVRWLRLPHKKYWLDDFSPIIHKGSSKGDDSLSQFATRKCAKALTRSEIFVKINDVRTWDRTVGLLWLRV